LTSSLKRKRNLIESFPPLEGRVRERCNNETMEQFPTKLKMTLKHGNS
jgi:hypothetical protein